jgi:hypothetical protein
MFCFPKLYTCFQLDHPTTLNLAVNSEVNSIPNHEEIEHVEEGLIACRSRARASDSCFRRDSHTALRSLPDRHRTGSLIPSFR